MNAYDTVVAGLSVVGLILLGLVTTFGTSDYHSNAAQLEERLQRGAEYALAQAGHDWASVEVNGQRAFLTGAPPTSEAATEAEALVLSSTGQGGYIWGGVWSVTSDFETAPALPTVSPYVFRAVKRPNGSWILLGSVPSPTIAEELATYASGSDLAPVENRLQPAYGIPSDDWPDIARFGLDQLSRLDSGELRLSDFEVMVRGISMQDVPRIEVAAAMANLVEPWSGSATVRGPSHWRADHVNDTLVLSGRVEAEEDRDAIISIAQANFEGEIVDDMRVTPSDLDAWVEGVELGLPHFSRFETGEMAFEPEEGGFRFEGEATSSTLQYLREDMDQLTGTYAANIEAQTVTLDIAELEGVELSEDPVEACQTSFDLVLQSNKVLFESGNAVISRGSGLTLDKIMAVAAFCDTSLRFELAGHTDNTGEREANIALSRARAQAVANYMQAAGFAGERLVVTGFGPDQPIADNMTPEGRAENRRIEFRIQERSE